MGCAYPKPRWPKEQSSTNMPPTMNNNRVPIRNKDQMYIDFIRKDYYEDFETFLVNNMFLAVMFFENYEEDVKILLNKSEREMEIAQLNTQLMQEHQKTIIRPDTLYEQVNRNIRFQREHGHEKHKSMPLLPERIFVVDEKIEISSVDEDDYCNIDTFKAKLIKTNNLGFVKLRQFDTGKTPSTSSNSSNGSGKAIYDVSTPSTSRQSEDGEYSGINFARTKQPLNISAAARAIFPTVSKKFIKSVQVDNNSLDTEDCYKYEKYLCSREIASHFKRAEFPHVVGPALGFTEDDIAEAEHMQGTVYCRSSEITSVLDIQWPDYCTNHWLLRQPNQIKNDVTNEEYEWPKRMMKEAIKSHKCVVIPRGFLNKHAVNSEKDIEWEIAFPRVEKFIQLHMSHTQTRCFFFLVLLHKTFIEPITEHRGLVIDHLRLLIYWEMEQNYLYWPATRLGRKLNNILRNLMENLGNAKQHHYFHHHKNIFANIPKPCLYQAQGVINAILENPVPYVLHALRNIRYTKDQFYPPFDFKKLYEMLKETHLVTKPMTIGRQTSLLSYNKDEVTDGEAREIKMIQQTKKIVDKRTEKTEKENAFKGNLNVEPRLSVDSIDLNWKCKIGKKEVIRKRNILIMFIKHFIEMGRASLRLSTYDDAMLYLKQASNLTVILEEHRSNQEQVNNFNATIESEQAECLRHRAREPPAVPSRTSVLTT